jgi:HSP20 family protein
MPQISVHDQNQENKPEAQAPSTTNWKPEEIPQLTIDVYRQDERIFVLSTVAGVNPEDIDISVEAKTLTIRGFRRKPYNETNSTVLLEECFWGEFYRELTINENLDVDRIKASLNQGILIIEIPILKLNIHRKIEVGTGK